MARDEIAIKDIVIKKRVRKDLGDLTDLCDSIKRLGVLQPIITTPDNVLVSGERRIAACKELGRDKIRHAYVNNLNEARLLLEAERDENTCRKAFTPSEAVAMAELLAPLKQAEAKARQRIRKGNQPGAKSAESAELSTGQSRDAVAKLVGMGRTSLVEATAVVEAAKADPKTFGPIVEEMDRTGKVHTAYKKVRGKGGGGTKPKARVRKVKDVPVADRLTKIIDLLEVTEELCVPSVRGLGALRKVLCSWRKKLTSRLETQK